ncbi:MAG: cell wall-binding repeat-containing protein, partial [Acidimicrobiales bacterium]
AAPALTPGTGILLVDKDSATIPAATVNALRIGGVDTVYIIGGEGAVPAALATALDNLPNYNCAGAVETVPILGTPKTLDIVRIGGNDRYETGRNVAERPGLGAAGTVDYDGTAADPDGPACSAKKTAILATGENFPDALVAGPVSFQGLVPVGAPGGTVVPPGLAGCGNNGGFPLILTTGTALHPQAASALTNLGIQQVIIMGGTAAVTTATESAVQAIGGITTRRFAGLNRLDTAKQFDDFAIGFLGYSRTVVSVARGDTFPDALTGGPNAGTPGPTPNVIALTESPTTVGTETTAFFKSRPGTVGVFGATAPLSPITDVDVYGGTAAVADSTVSAILATISQA